LIGLLRTAPPHQQQAKDILRAARLPLLAVDDPEVVTDLQKIRRGKALSPILLVAGDLATGRTLQVADGYHRACASYHVDEDAEVPCRVATLPSVAISYSCRPCPPPRVGDGLALLLRPGVVPPVAGLMKAHPRFWAPEPGRAGRVPCR